MSLLTRTTTVVLILSFSTAPALAAEEPDAADGTAKQWVWLQSQGVWGYGSQIQESPQRGLWKIEPGMKVEPVAADPYGFTEVLNRIRTSMGLAPAAYDPELSSWAAQNNVAQNSQGLGHHVNPNCYQNSGWNYPDAASAAAGWMNSPAHRDTMLLASMTRFGIAYGPG